MHFDVTRRWPIGIRGGSFANARHGKPLVETQLGMAFAEDESFKPIALEDIPKDTKLFFSHKVVMDDEGNWDEDKATWLLAHWGIPSAPLEMSQVEEHAPYENVMSLC